MKQATQTKSKTVSAAEVSLLIPSFDSESCRMLSEVINKVIQHRYYEVTIRLDNQKQIESFALKENALHFELNGRLSDYMKGAERVCLHIEGKNNITSGYREHKFRRHSSA